MSELAAIMQAYSDSWLSTAVSFVSSGVAWYLYLRLRSQVKAQEVYKGELMSEAAKAINTKKANGKTAQAYQMGILQGLGALSNLVIKGADEDGRTDTETKI